MEANITSCLCGNSGNATPPTFAAPLIDPRLAFLARADALLFLVEAFALSIDDAIDRLMPAILEIAGCQCHREILDRFDEAARERGDHGDHHGDQDHDDVACHCPAADNGWLRGLVRAVVNAAEDQRNAILFWTACRGGEAVRDGKADEGFVATVLIEAAMRAGLPVIEARNTVKSGMGRA
jgi:hypothetical protein